MHTVSHAGKTIKRTDSQHTQKHAHTHRRTHSHTHRQKSNRNMHAHSVTHTVPHTYTGTYAHTVSNTNGHTVTHTKLIASEWKHVSYKVSSKKANFTQVSHLGSIKFNLFQSNARPDAVVLDLC